MENRPNPDPNLASELRQGAGRDWTEEAAEDERLTELQRRRRLTLADQAKEFINRRDRVSVEFGGHSFTGGVVSGGEDYATVEGPGQVADIRLAAARWSLLPSDRASEPSPGGPESFRALLHQYAASEENVRLALPGEDMVIGKIRIIADDHVELDDVDSRRLIIPIQMILAVVRSSDFH